MTTIREVLRGTRTGRMQTVGYMQVIPLLADIQDDRFAAPNVLEASTVRYGSVVFNNISDKPTLIPSHLTYVVKQRAQDHALCSASVIESRKHKQFDNAACVEQTQGGFISKGQHTFAILPFPIREAALAKRKEQEYSKLWSTIGQFNQTMGLAQGSGHLKVFLNHFARELDQFVAEFENVPKQVGAIVLVNGRVVGVERTPSTQYWSAIWQPLIRECYGSLALQYATQNRRPAVTRVALKDSGITSLEQLRTALVEANHREEEKVRQIVRELVDEPFAIDREEKVLDFRVETLKHQQFVGQTIREGDNVLYASFIACNDWLTNERWRNANAFAI